MNITSPIGVTATLNQGTGFGGLLKRYTTSIVIGNNGIVEQGYGLMFYRGDQNFANSEVRLVSNGLLLASMPSTFQYDATIDIQFTISLDGSVQGSVKGSGSVFFFNFPPRLMALVGSNIEISMDNSMASADNVAFSN